MCHLRNKKTADAKKIVKEVIEKINNISSERTKHQFQKRFIERIEEECILTELIGVGEAHLNVKEIEAKAILLIQRSTDSEIFGSVHKSVSFH